MLAVIQRGAETSGQTQVRLVVLLLVTLGVAAAVVRAGRRPRRVRGGLRPARGCSRTGHESLEHKLEGLAFGLLIPVFFITSGMAIDPQAVLDEPVALVAFVALILLVRGGLVLLATRTTREDGRRVFDGRESVAMGLFAATGLPIIVAVTSVAVGAGEMTATNASVLVAGGAVTVLVCPLLAQRLLTRRDHPVQVNPRAERWRTSLVAIPGPTSGPDAFERNAVDSFWDFFWFIISFFLLMAYLVVLFQILTDLFRDQRHQRLG